MRLKSNTPYVYTENNGANQKARFGPILGAGGVAGGLYAANKFFPQKHLSWNKVVSGVRGIESASPAAVLRTFRTSEILSPLESPQNLSMGATRVAGAGKYTEALRSMFGAGIQDIQYVPIKGEGFGRIYSAGKQVGVGIQIQAGTQTGAGIADYFARIYGVDLPVNRSMSDDLLKAMYQQERPAVPYKDWVKSLTMSERQKRLIIGAPLRPTLGTAGKRLSLDLVAQERLAKSEVITNLMRSKSASSVGRLNTLLSKPFEMPVVGKPLSRLPVIKDLSVKPGTSLQMTGRFIGKATKLAMGWTALEYYDYLRASDSAAALPAGVLGGAVGGAALLRKAGQPFSKAGLIGGALAGAFVSLAPRFDKGLLHGLASIGTDARLAQAEISEATGATEDIQRQEEVTPGLMSPATGLAFGVTAALATGFYGYGSLLKEATAKQFTGEGVGAFADTISEIRLQRQQTAALGKFPALTEKIKKLPGGKALAGIKSKAGLAFLGGFAAWGVLSTGLALASGNPLAAFGGLLGTEDTPEELRKIYSGEELVPVRKGRWWEAGRTPFEGSNTEYYRPHFMRRLETRAYEKGVYGTEEEKWEHSPLLNPFKALFGSDEWKYHYELKHQYDRPGVMTSTYGEDIPFLGPLVAETFGKLIKPRKLVRPEEWMNEEGRMVYHSKRPELEPVPELGGLAPPDAVSPGESSQLFNELMYRRREAIGLVGFAEGAIQKKLTNREEFFENKPTLSAMGVERSSEHWLWTHLNIGGGLLSSEPIRRFIPHKRNYLDTYNPLKNTLPSWIPEDYFTDLKYGNPLEKVKEGEIRLPGPGYASLYPELEGVDPEMYPLAHKVKILGDVAMWSPEYRQTLRKAKGQIGEMTEAEATMVRSTQTQVTEKKKRRKFQDYKFSQDLLEPVEATVTEVITPTRFRTKEFGDTIVELPGIQKIIDAAGAMAFAEENLLDQKLSLLTPTLESERYDITAAGPRMRATTRIGDEEYGAALAAQGYASAKELEGSFAGVRYSAGERLAGSLSERILHKAETPLEYLTPASPMSKLVRARSPLEDYIATQAVGTESAFWDKPLKNFIEPAANMAGYQAGLTEIPESVQERRDIQEYFDMLQWTKKTRLLAAALEQGDVISSGQYQKQRRETAFGVNPYGDPSSVMRALPRSERDYYNEFVNLRTAEEQQLAAQLVPENEQRIYKAQWLDKAAEASFAKKQAGIETKEDEKILVANNMMRRSEGMSYTQEMEKQWMAETGGRVPFAEWLRMKKANNYFETHSLPGADWLGWSPSVDLDDIKMKYVETAGHDYHNFGLWGDRQKMLARKPYINEDVIAELESDFQNEGLGNESANMRNLGRMNGDRYATSGRTLLSARGNSSYNINIQDGRQKLVNDAYKIMGA